MSGHRDVNIPPSLRSRLGKLLQGFETFLKSRVVKQWMVNKEPGGHVTSWWIYAVLSARAPSSSIVVFGETRHDDVNPIPHLRVRGKAKWIAMGYNLLLEYTTAELAADVPPMPRRPPPLPVWRTLAPFNGAEYGNDYLIFNTDMEIMPAEAPVDVDAEGWHFGILVRSGARGWYPPAFVR